MTKAEQLKILDEFSFATSRLTTKMIPIIQKSYDDINLIDLLMNLPIKFELNEVDPDSLPKKKDGSQVTLKEVALGGYITRDSEAGNPDRLVVFLTFTKSTEKSWEDYFKELVDDTYYHNTLAFIYMHEAMHILLRHYDFYLSSTFMNIIDGIRNDLGDREKNELLNHAFDYYINGYLLEQANTSSIIHGFSNDNSGFIGLYDANLSPAILQQSEIVQKLAKEAKVTQTSILDPEGNEIGHVTEIDLNGNISRTITMDGGQGDITQ